MAPLDNLLVLDFSALLPGPLATLFMVDAGATVLKIERPERGDEMRNYSPSIGRDSINFIMLNRGKQSLALDLKEPASKQRLLPLIARADVLIEQFRPGVMTRLGLGYEELRKINPRLIYCSITGWGQTGPKSTEPGHDLNFMAETGILGLSVGSEGAPILPPVLAGDIAGGTYPALVNILLALLQREKTGEGRHIDISMSENLLPFIYWALGNAQAFGRWPVPGGETVTGDTPRYQIYKTKDGRHLACAALEEKFWANFTEVIGLASELRHEGAEPAAVKAAVAGKIAMRSAADWKKAFSGIDVCCSIVASLEEALQNPQFSERGVFDRTIEAGQRTFAALPTIISPAMRSSSVKPSSPGLGEHTDPRFKI